MGSVPGKQDRNTSCKALVKSHESEKRLIKKCRDLNAEIMMNSQNVQTALKLSQEDQANITQLRKDIETQQEMVEQSHVKEKQAKEQIQQYKDRRWSIACRIPFLKLLSLTACVGQSPYIIIFLTMGGKASIFGAFTAWYGEVPGPGEVSRKHPIPRDAILLGPKSQKALSKSRNLPDHITWSLETLKQALWASCDVMLAS